MNNQRDNWPKYFVSYCVMDMDAGANPFGHSCLIFSSQHHENAPIRAIDSYGYYSQPNSSSNPVISFIKRMLGLNVDLQDVHGVLKQEDMRYLEGAGLKATSFEVSNEKFEQILQSISTNIQEEEQAINEANRALEQLNQPKNGVTRLNHEQDLARREGRPSRLNKFHLTLDHHFSTAQSYTCKTRAIDILRQHEVIDDQQASLLKGEGFSFAFPRSSTLELNQLRMVSCGRRYPSSNGLFFNHYWDKNQLYWATPLIQFQQELNDDEKINVQKTYQRLNTCLKQKDELTQKLYQARQTTQSEWRKLQLEGVIEQLENESCQLSRIEQNQDLQQLEQTTRDLQKLINYSKFIFRLPQADSLLNRFYEHYTTNILLGLITTVGFVNFLAPSSWFLVMAYTLNLLHAAYTSYQFYQKEQALHFMKQDYLVVKPRIEPEPENLSELFNEENQLQLLNLPI
jgi:hypothetical protein